MGEDCISDELFLSSLCLFMLILNSLQISSAISSNSLIFTKSSS